MYNISTGGNRMEWPSKRLAGLLPARLPFTRQPPVTVSPFGHGLFQVSKFKLAKRTWTCRHSYLGCQEHQGAPVVIKERDRRGDHVSMYSIARGNRNGVSILPGSYSCVPSPVNGLVDIQSLRPHDTMQVIGALLAQPAVASVSSTAGRAPACQKTVRKHCYRSSIFRDGDALVQ